MTEILFYHLQNQPLERALPSLLERCLERNWRAVVQTGSDERRDALDSVLWTYADDSFLPHGTARDGDAADQPVWLTSGDENPNGAVVRFLVDRAVPPDLGAYLRAVFMFDGNDPDAVAEARGHWKAGKEQGHDMSYWQQDERGRWLKKA